MRTSRISQEKNFKTGMGERLFAFLPWLYILEGGFVDRHLGQNRQDLGISIRSSKLRWNKTEPWLAPIFFPGDDCLTDIGGKNEHAAGNHAQGYLLT